jgi:hypothetical protein
MSSAYVSVSGIDQNEDAETIFVRHCNGNPEDALLLGAVSGVGGSHLLPGIQVGQFSITFLLPDGCSADNIVVSRDKSKTELVSGVTITRSLIREEAWSGGTIIPDNPPVRPGGANVASYFTNPGQIITGQTEGLEP